MKTPTEQFWETIQQRRQEIDILDLELLRLISQRARIALELASIKQSSGLPVLDEHRERRIVERMCGANPGPLDEESVAGIFRCIIRESRRVEEDSTAGPKNSYFKKEEDSHGDQYGSRRV